MVNVEQVTGIVMYEDRIEAQEEAEDRDLLDSTES